MKTKPRVFVSVPDDRHFVDHQGRIDERRIALKKSIVGFIKNKGFELEGFEPEQFGAGLATRRAVWTVEGATRLIRRCDGALILALARTRLQVLEPTDGSGQSTKRMLALPTPYNHLEGALAIAQQLPLLILYEEGMNRDGIFASGIKPAAIPEDANEEWVHSTAFRGHFTTWAKEVGDRRDVFLGYCSKADSTARRIRDHLESKGFSVLDWARDFRRAGATILEEIERAAGRCRCAVFLFTTDDELEKTATAKATFTAVPRDNVLLEAGYFSQARGKERVAIVRENGAKMPADLGGIIYVPLKSRRSLLSVKEGLDKFLAEAL